MLFFILSLPFRERTVGWEPFVLEEGLFSILCWTLREKAGTVHTLTKSASELSGSKGKYLDKVRETAEVFFCTEPLQLKFFSLPRFESIKPDQDRTSPEIAT